MVIHDVIAYLEKKYLPALAADFDAERIGLSIGDGQLPLKKILLALDLTIDVASEALAKDVNLIITHHPFIFDPLYKIQFATPKGKVIKHLCQHDISLYVMHTNLDAAEGGMNDVLATRLGLRDIRPAGDVIFKESYMRIGDTNPQPLSVFTSLVRERFGSRAVKVAGRPEKMIRKVGIVGGAGASADIIGQAITLGLDCFITGEIKLHIAQYAHSYDLALIEVEHGIEKLFLPELKAKMEKDLLLAGRVFVSKIKTDPFFYDF